VCTLFIVQHKYLGLQRELSCAARAVTPRGRAASPRRLPPAPKSCPGPRGPAGAPAAAVPGRVWDARPRHSPVPACGVSRHCQSFGAGGRPSSGALPQAPQLRSSARHSVRGRAAPLEAAKTLRWRWGCDMSPSTGAPAGVRSKCMGFPPLN